MGGLGRGFEIQTIIHTLIEFYHCIGKGISLGIVIRALIALSLSLGDKSLEGAVHITSVNEMLYEGIEDASSILRVETASDEQHA